jgi:hypothetical protein
MQIVDSTVNLSGNKFCRHVGKAVNRYMEFRLGMC